MPCRRYPCMFDRTCTAGRCSKSGSEKCVTLLRSISQHAPVACTEQHNRTQSMMITRDVDRAKCIRVRNEAIGTETDEVTAVSDVLITVLSGFRRKHN